MILNNIKFSFDKKDRKLYKYKNKGPLDSHWFWKGNSFIPTFCDATRYEGVSNETISSLISTEWSDIDSIFFWRLLINLFNVSDKK